ncbi:MULTISPECIES: WS/DGAT/MGAT family O-acyltransferase [Mycobacteriaceae]|uniref:Diacylglycerol O-acyltransferase n=1 Tax=Mycolicibacterium neoaurum VKM Ac-1815D TaxID=700508 RepID=V5XCL5_MYCNE|nr:MULTISPECIES: hypothetical protein [Mycobacteriaceae]AHC25543.1 hypothetical protein D174_13560 [Mycolicibacterium neoaurum VKM Ac-1815D]AMO06004.1 hypothetical protein MyAD_13310 [Mycolicibacterium neoaurum]AXK75663.1 hypothetical protein DXK33_11675 [Mycolicibacterium neoaurum]KJQ50483.1 hypothetical protein TS71_11125 [Mycolicibacterium neoaurum]KUM09669.1 hypothetical protein AVZ31_05650 [Mycolicibacterium neoaurum]
MEFTNGDAVGNRLTLWDEAMVRANRATGRVQMIQVVWVYEHPVNMDQVRRFHRNFGYGMAGRRVERSPLPFGRYRWVAALGPAAPLHVNTDPLPRAEIGDWADRWAQVTVDPEDGPGWQMAVQSFTDGVTAISVVGSHCLGDGVAALLAVGTAVAGANIDIGYPPPLSRRTGRAIVEDLRETVRELPTIARAARKAVKVLRAGAQEAAQEAAPKGAPARPAIADPHERVIVPAITAYVDLAEWDARAESLGGNGYSMLAAICAKLGERMGRRNPDGNISLLIAISDRTAQTDVRANAMSLVNAKIDPTDLTKDLSGTRATLRNALKSAKDQPDEILELMPLTPLVPKRLVKKVADIMIASDDKPVVCSNMGDLPSMLASVDGTEAEYTSFFGIDQATPRVELESGDGQLVVVSGRLNGKVIIGIVAYEAGAENSKSRLRTLTTEALAEFDLTGVFV